MPERLTLHGLSPARAYPLSPPIPCPRLSPIPSPHTHLVYRHGPAHDERRYFLALPTHNQSHIVDTLSRDEPYVPRAPGLSGAASHRSRNSRAPAELCREAN